MAPEYYIFTGRDGEVIPQHITHVLIANGLRFVRARSFYRHPNIQEVICHNGVEKIEEEVFSKCPRLRRVIMPGVKEVEKMAFDECEALTYIECGKLERIGVFAFRYCKSLSSIDLPSIKIVREDAFTGCKNLINAKFGEGLESIGAGACYYCYSLECITLPLKDGMLTDDNIFQGCAQLYRVDLVGGVHETIAALLSEKWRNDMNEVIESISQILSSAPAGDWVDTGRKTHSIRAWITSILYKIIHYKAEHRSYLNEAATTLQSALPNDIVSENIIPFLELPSYTFDGED